MHPVERHSKTHLGQSVAGHTCRALTTLIWCSSPIACTQWWNREFMLSWICWTSSPSKHSNLDSRYSKLTWNMINKYLSYRGRKITNAKWEILQKILHHESTRLNPGLKQTSVSSILHSPSWETTHPKSEDCFLLGLPSKAKQTHRHCKF